MNERYEVCQCQTPDGQWYVWDNLKGKRINCYMDEKPARALAARRNANTPQGKCPTCGAHCVIRGKTTLHYEPVECSACTVMDDYQDLGSEHLETVERLEAEIATLKEATT